MQKRHSLIVKLTLATSLILIGFMVLLDYLNVKNFQKVMQEYSISTADQMAEIINQSAYDAMLKNDKESLYKMIDRIGKGKSVDHIRLIDREGRIAYSSNNKEIGTVIDKSAEACAMCHKGKDPKLYASTMHRSRLFTNSEGKEMLGLTNAIYNQPTCAVASCHFHQENQKVLGLLDIEVSMANMRLKTQEYHAQFFVIACVMLLITGGSLTFLTQRLVNRPVQRLVRHTTLVSAGDLNSRVPAASGDELGELAKALNRMTENLKMAHEELTRWGYNLEEKVEERTVEIKKIETQLRRSEKLASLGKLVAGIAHEINNPLTGVLLYSSILTADKRLDPELKPDLERITSESQRCADIVSRLLEFSREAVPRKEAVSLNALLDKVVTLVHKQPTFSEISIIKDYSGHMSDILVDPNQVQQVFVNLFINASHAMPSGGTLTIRTCMINDDGFACAEIKDTGHGIDAEHLNHIFDPFFTTKADGTGLGLSISYGIVENNGGKIEVKSRLGEGTTFTISLPVYDNGFLDDIMI
ncbi:sensor histidine kinase [Pelotalea chapellei]|uniref:histidine kinase n=1 Tax=Pelotalea chapellei TaxID=44671 RepID=A0ABS5U6W7_9BACT|nr:HAMP domain-containing sensor histidine kinase [Pelotalea chapellei]MBT1071401.1 HAMP domain-containing protein [Pelotalea chapellei]